MPKASWRVSWCVWQLSTNQHVLFKYGLSGFCENYFFNFSHLSLPFIKVSSSLLDPTDMILLLNMELKVAHTYCMCVYQLKCGLESVLDQLHNLHITSYSQVLSDVLALWGDIWNWFVSKVTWLHNLAHHYTVHIGYIYLFIYLFFHFFFHMAVQTVETELSETWSNTMFVDTVRLYVGCLLRLVGLPTDSWQYQTTGILNDSHQISPLSETWS